MTMIPFFPLAFVLSLVVAFLGRNRKLGFWGYFFASLLLTPLLGAILVIISAPAAAPPTSLKPKRRLEEPPFRPDSSANRVS